METGMGSNMGGGEVHSRVSSQPYKGEGMSGKMDAGEGPDRQGGGGEEGMMGQARQQAEQTVDDVRERAEEMVGQARNRIADVPERASEMMDQTRNRASEMMGQARTRATEMMDQAESTLEERTGAISRVRENPLPALGLAFAAGFLLAGGGDDEKRSRRRGGGVMNKALHQVSGAVMGGVSAAIAQELRGTMGQAGGLGEMLRSFLGQQSGDSGSMQGGGQSSQATRGSTGTTM